MLDQDLNAWVLEVNGHPSLNVMFTQQYMCSKKGEEVLSQTDLTVKSIVLKNSILLSQLTSTQSASKYNCHQIYPPTEDGFSAVTKYLLDIKMIFHSLCSIRDKEAITTTQFAKLLTLPDYKHLSKAQVSTCFEKCASGKRMDFY